MKFKLDDIADVRRYTELQQSRLTQLAEAVATDFYDIVMEMTPVRTGRLRDGWQKEGLDVINDVEYLSYVNDGTVHQLPQRFVERAKAATLERIDGHINDIKNRNS